jgi:ABC-type polysaccharide/polyol phosphate export permease
MNPLRGKLTDLWHARELLRQFVAKELKIRYKNSALGFFWSLLTPALMTVVFTALFGFAFRLDIDDYAAFFLSGYLLWQFFQTSSQSSITAIVGNGGLIKKVYFPREVLPLSMVLAQLTHFLLALLVLSPVLIAFRGWGVLLHLPAALVVVAIMTVFTSGMAMIWAGANVPFRDLQELIVVIFLVWFYATPVLYPLALLEASGRPAVQAMARVVELNPMSWFIELFRTAMFGEVTAVAGSGGGGGVTDIAFTTTPPTLPDAELFALATAFSLLVFGVGYVFFNRLALTFAKEV